MTMKMKLNLEQLQQLIKTATDPSKRYTTKDLMDYVNREFGISYSHSGLTKLLNRNGVKLSSSNITAQTLVKAPVIPKPKTDNTPAKPLLKSKKGSYYDTVAEFEAREREKMAEQEDMFKEIKELMKEM